MRDVTQTPDEETPYECFECGAVVVAEDKPDACPQCESEMRNRQIPLE
ncbi:rubrerythrin-like domain-containing protein [Halorientalis brevis]|uniref:Rubrerythrin-like domain-containing protein n=1 Tax=Halorientalis brevis TaxID=1126241 RepID=A0ABD6C986_9EURY|nr:rubrerythrin-like domain-containing protein [Halorientalis brevis]